MVTTTIEAINPPTPTVDIFDLKLHNLTDLVFIESN